MKKKTEVSLVFTLICDESISESVLKEITNKFNSYNFELIGGIELYKRIDLIGNHHVYYSNRQLIEISIDSLGIHRGKHLIDEEYPDNDLIKKTNFVADKIMHILDISPVSEDHKKILASLKTRHKNHSLLASYILESIGRTPHLENIDKITDVLILNEWHL